ncbi:putative Ig domain-containing protein [Chitiniphilus purpureus]|uniref:Ig domain-containing protein n=1 Tax=Chitiniphilus purpureus TaxID=2981137 RepID=A0ABY6DHU0_9NEIS|nr:putative Ig domain-containing protein [Chitiniphilus sp. CD1]UXY13915.1 putative Ig domain-containing protein [Chitiniphilus sp. CD1]
MQAFYLSSAVDNMYSNEALAWVDSLSKAINETASKVGISAAAIAGAMCEECDAYYNRNEFIFDDIVSLFSHEAIRSDYESFKNGNDDYTYLDKMHRPAVNDVGRGNFKVATAIDLVIEYSNKYPQFGLSVYLNDYALLVENLIDPEHPLTAQLYAIYLKEKALSFFKTNNAYGDNWDALPLVYQDALLITYSNRGEKSMQQAKIDLYDEKGFAYEPSPGLTTSGGLNHLANAQAISNLVGLSNYTDTLYEIDSFKDLALQGDAAGLAARFALSRLRSVAIEGLDGTQDETSFSLYNEASGEGNISRQWITDRHAMLIWKNQFDKSDVSYTNQLNASNTVIPTSVLGDYLYQDYKLGLNLQINFADRRELGNHNIIFGDAQNDTLNGNGLSDRLYGNLGEDTLTGADGADYLEGGEGHDALYGGSGNDILLGMSENDVLHGDDGNDSLQGGVGNDALSGGNGDDTLVGGKDDDVLDGGQGTNLLIGGQGYDAYYAAVGSGLNIIRDEDGLGEIRINGVRLGSITPVNQGGWSATHPDGEVRIQLSSEGKLVIAYSGGKFVIDNFKNGDLGINLESYSQPNGTFDRFIEGDRKPIDQDLTEPGIQVTTDELGNVIVNADQAESGRTDLLYGSIGKDHIRGWHGNDTIIAYQGGSPGDILVGGGGLDVINAGEGNDLIFADEETDGIAALLHSTGTQKGEAGDLLFAAEGNDTLVGSNKDDVMFGGDGSDLIVGGDGDDNMIDDDHVEAVNGSNYTLSSRLNPKPVTRGNQGFQGFGFNVDYLMLRSSAQADGNDSLYGGGGNDWMISHEGNDFLDGGIGNDALSGGRGNDDLIGSNGDDLLLGGISYDPQRPSDEDADFLDGGEGNDSLLGGYGKDTLLGGIGNDVMLGDRDDDPEAVNGDDFLNGGEGNDELYGGSGDDTLIGGEGNDTVSGDGAFAGIGPSGNDIIQGNGGNDILVGGVGNDTIDGGDGDDQLCGDINILPAELQGADVLDGGAGNDTLVGLGAGDTLSGGEGNDYLHGDSDLLSGEMHGNDHMDGGSGDDYLVGAGGSDALYGGDGNDVLNGDADPLGDDYHGADHLDGGTGDDQLDGGGKNDTLLGGSGNDFLLGGYGEDSLSGGEDSDQLQGGLGNDVLDGGRGNDDLYGNEDLDLLRGGDGNDYLSGGDGADRVEGDEGNDGIYGDRGNDTLLGGAGDDGLFGGEGNDRLEGNAGLNELHGEEGDDILLGGIGLNQLYGGNGNDEYQVQLSQGSNLIHDATGMNLIKIMDPVALDQIRLDIGSDAEGRSYLVLYLGDLNTGNYLAIENGLTVENFQIQFSGLPSITISELLKQLNAAEYARHTAPLNLVGTGGDDTLIGEFGNDTLSGLEGNDLLLGSDGHDLLQGGNGHDQLSGESGNDTLIGGAGDDSLYGGEGDDVFIVESGGNDIILDSSGANSIVFANGVNRDHISVSKGIDHFGQQALVLTYSTGRVVISDGLSGAIESVQFADGSVLSYKALLAEFDTISWNGGAGDDSMAGSTGDDFLFGAGGNDTVAAGLGADQVWGAEGNDQLSGGDGQDILSGGSGSDLLVGGEGKDTLNGDDGQDTLQGGLGRDSLSGGAANDELDGGDADDLLEGGVGSDTLAGGIGHDALLGDEGDDILAGEAGDDLLDGGAGNDLLQGGQGSDSYVLGLTSNGAAGWGNDVIRDQPGDYNYIVLAREFWNQHFSSSRQGNDIIIYRTGSEDTIRVEDYYLSPESWLVKREGDTGDQQVQLLSEWLQPASPPAAPVLDDWKSAFKKRVEASYFTKTKGTQTNVSSSDSGSSTITTHFNLQFQATTYAEEQMFWVNSYSKDELVSSNSQTRTVTTRNNLSFGISEPSAGYVRVVMPITYPRGNYEPTQEIMWVSAKVAHLIGTADLIGWPTPMPGYVSSKGYGTFSTTTITNTVNVWSQTRIFQDATGNDLNNQISVGAGNLVDGGAGDDVISVSSYWQDISLNDVGAFMFGNAGNDTITGGDGGDVLVGGDGLNILQGGAGADQYIITDGIGHDIVYDASNSSEVNDQDVLVLPSAGGLTTRWTTIVAPANEELVNGGRISFENLVRGFLPYGYLYAMAPHKALEISWGTEKSVTVVLPQNNPNNGIEYVQFGSGNRVPITQLQNQATGEEPEIDWEKDNTVVTPAPDFGQEQGVVLTGFQGNDLLMGNGAIDGGIGNDTIHGGIGDDILFGSKGADHFIGGAGNDIIAPQMDDYFDAGNIYEGGAGNDTLLGTRNSDTYIYNQGDGVDIIGDFYHQTNDYSAYHDTSMYSGVLYKEWAGVPLKFMEAMSNTYSLDYKKLLDTPDYIGTDTLQFGEGISIQDIDFQVKGDSLYIGIDDGHAGGILLAGWYRYAAKPITKFTFVDGTNLEEATIPSLAGGTAQHDYIVGDATSQTLTGYEGNDTLEGGDGNDTLLGGLGNDVFVFATGDGRDVIADIGDGVYSIDTLKLNGISPANMEAAVYGNDIVLKTGSHGDSIVLQGAAGNDNPVDLIDFGNDVIWDVQQLWGKAVYRSKPYLNGEIAVQILQEDQGYAFQLPADLFTDPSQQPETLTYTASLANGQLLPSWLSFNSETLTFSGLPENSHVGTELVKVMAQDSFGQSAELVFQIIVENQNDAPISLQAGLDFECASGMQFAFALPPGLFSDADYSDQLTLSTSTEDGVQLPAWLNFDSALGVFTGQPSPMDVGIHRLNVSATDRSGASVSVILAITVAPAVESGPMYESVTIGTTEADYMHGSTERDHLAGGEGPDQLYGGGNDDFLDGGAGTDYLQGNDGNDQLQAGQSDDQLYGGEGSDTIIGGTGADWLDGGNGDDVYRFKRGDGYDQLTDASGNDRLVFESATSDQLWFKQVGVGVEIGVIGSSDAVLLRAWAVGTDRIERIEAADGKALLNTQVDALVSAMAGFNPPPAGQTTLPDPLREQLQPVLAANWR